MPGVKYIDLKEFVLQMAPLATAQDLNWWQIYYLMNCLQCLSRSFVENHLPIIANLHLLHMDMHM